jgi:hypothetical protein
MWLPTVIGLLSSNKRFEMIIQTGTRESFERVWINVLNTQGASLTLHWPAGRYLTTGPTAASVVHAQNAGLPTTARGAIVGGGGNAIGLCDETIPAGDVGLVQIYGYHASVLIAMLNSTAKTVIPGHPLGQVEGDTIGLSSAPAAVHICIALDTIGNAHHSLCVAGSAASYGDHVYLRAM